MKHATVYVQNRHVSLSFIVCIEANGKGEQGLLPTKRVSLWALSAKQESWSSDDVYVTDVWRSMVNEFSITTKRNIGTINRQNMYVRGTAPITNGKSVTVVK